ncbi:MAG TPA: glycosyltransferase [Thermoanaerobaculia bacterium]|nr:glycosyltransferase [Thermoanaerobaculia bacterium]
MFVHQDAAQGLLRKYAGESVDAVHGHALLPYVAARRLYAGKAVTSFSVHSPVRDEFRATARLAGPIERLRLRVAGELLHRFERECLEGSDYVTAESEFTRALLQKGHGSRLGDRARVIPGWVDDRFRPATDRGAEKAQLGLPDDRPTLFTLRRLVPRMGLDLLLWACGRLARRGRTFCLAIAGEGPLRSLLEAQVRKEGLGEIVVFLGRVSDADLPRWYAAADAFVLPTSALECFGLIALEAMASGRPVLATPAGAIPEVVGRFEPAWLAREVSVDALEEVLEKYLAGELPEHDPARLHEAVVREFGYANVLPRLVEATLGDAARDREPSGGLRPRDRNRTAGSV